MRQVASRVARASKSLIKDRLDGKRGSRFPQGGSTSYSTSPLHVPTEIKDYRGPTHKKAWAAVKQAILQYASKQKALLNNVGPWGDLKWVYFPGGYEQFRRVAGLGSVVDLQVTSKMIDDLDIKYEVKASSSGTRNNYVILLSISWLTQSSERISDYHKFGLNARRFDFWTEDDVVELRELTRALIRQAREGGGSGRDARGRFSGGSF